jgi:hypothetical protein
VQPETCGATERNDSETSGDLFNSPSLPNNSWLIRCYIAIALGKESSMIREYGLTEFDLSRFLKCPAIVCKCESGFPREETSCTSADELREKGGEVIGYMLIDEHMFPLDDYRKFCDITGDGCEEGFDALDDETKEYLIEEHGEAEVKRILSIAKEREWRGDTYIDTNPAGDYGVAFHVCLSEDVITVESGYVSDDSPTSSACFEESACGMPEVERMLENTVESCLRKRPKGRGKSQ